MGPTPVKNPAEIETTISLILNPIIYLRHFGHPSDVLTAMTAMTLPSADPDSAISTNTSIGDVAYTKPGFWRIQSEIRSVSKKY